MVTADIQINSVPGSDDNLPLGTLVSLANVSPDPVTTYEWAILSQPEGSGTDTLSSTTAPAPSFTPTKEGSYLLRLIVDKNLPSEARQQVIAAVRELETGNRIPAAGETVENNGTTGWANTAADEVLQRVTRLLDSGVVVGVAGAAGLTAGTVLRATGVQTIGLDAANQRVVPVFTAIDALTSDVETPELCVLLAGVDGNPAPASGALVRAKFTGLVLGVLYPASAPTVGDSVYVDDGAQLALTAGTVSRRCGTVAAVDTGAGTYDVFFGGGLSASGGAPAGPAGGVLGYPGSTYPDPNGLAATLKVSKFLNYLPIKSEGDGSIVTLTPTPEPVDGCGLLLAGGQGIAGDGGVGGVFGGPASSAGATSGSGVVDAGEATGLATAGTADVGTTNASSVNLGRSGKPVRTKGRNVETAASVAPLAATTVPVDAATILLTNAGAVGLLGAHPNLQTAGIEAGTRVTLIQTGAGTTTFWAELFDAGSAMRLDNATSVTLNQYDALTLVYTGTFWVQTSLSVNN